MTSAISPHLRWRTLSFQGECADLETDTGLKQKCIILILHHRSNVHNLNIYIPIVMMCMMCLWIMTLAHTAPVSCQQSYCEGGQSLTTGSSDISPQTNNIFDQNHMMNIIHLIEQTGCRGVSCQSCVCVTKDAFMYVIGLKHIMWVFLWIRKWWQTICIIGLWINERKMTSLCFLQQGELCESSCKQSVSDTSATRKHKQSIMRYIHSINNQMICCVLWLHGHSAPSLAAFSLRAYLYADAHLNQK